jgi:peptide/nickel transport system substrate-binding protein
MPQVSSDGLTWTFDMREGVRYGPPFEETEVTAGDVVRALQREADPRIARSSSSYAFLYAPILGFEEVRLGRTSTIAGLQTPDDHTLVVRLVEPAGDLGHRLALPAAAPIPPGAADHHRDYGPYLVSTGPYMFEGADDLDFSLPADRQVPVSGFVPFHENARAFTPGSITLVRDPSWDPTTDPLRAAYVDRIEIAIGGASVDYTAPYDYPADYIAANRRLFEAVLAGDLDLILDTSPPVGQLRRIRRDPGIAALVREHATSLAAYILLNLAVPPLDDVHVRRAMNLALDKAALLERWFDEVSGLEIPEADGSGTVANHLAPDATEGELLAGYRPSWMTPTNGGDLVEARAEMARSGYDHDGDGRCDAAVCRHVRLVETNVWPRSFDARVVADLARIGVQVDVRRLPPAVLYSANGPESPGARTAMLANDFLQDYPNGSAFFPQLFYGPNLRSDFLRGYFDFPMLGATPQELEGWGYEVSDVPSVDGRIRRCVVLSGASQASCWAALDQFLMEEIVPSIPFLFGTAVRLVSPRIARYAFDQSVQMPALDQISLTPEAIAADRA